MARPGGVRSPRGRHRPSGAALRPLRGAPPLALVGLLALACSGDRMIVAGQIPPDASTVSDAGPDAGLDGGRTTTGIGASTGCPATPRERRAVSGCWPPRQVGLWQGYWLGAPSYETADGRAADFPLGDVVLRFDDDGTGAFSVGTSPPPSAGGCEPGSDAGACTRFGTLLAGHAYQLNQVQLQDAGERGVSRILGVAPPRAGELLEFAVRLGEPWDAWCSANATDCRESACPATRAGQLSSAAAAIDTSRVACRCDADSCAAEAPVLAIALTMSLDGRALRGAYQPGDPRLPTVRLELLRVEVP